MSILDSQVNESTNTQTEQHNTENNITQTNSDAQNVLDTKPDFLRPKFKTVDDQAKAYVELEKKLGSFIGAPDEYVIEMDGFQPDDMYTEMSTVAKELNMSNDGFNKLVNKYYELQKKYNQQAEEHHMGNMQAELAKLGDNRNEIISGVNTWMKNNLDDEGMQYIKNKWIKTADDVKALAKLKDAWTKQSFNNQPKADIGITYNDDIHVQLEQAVNSERYKTDLKYQEHINDLYLKTYG